MNNMVNKKPRRKLKKSIGKPKKYKCVSCGMLFFDVRKKGEKNLTCPFCESELYHTLITK